MSTPRLVGCAAAIISLLVVGSTAHAQSLAWAKQAGGLDIDEARGIAVDAAGNTYVTGIFSKPLACPFCGNPATFGTGQPNPVVLIPVLGTQDIFIAKYDPNGLLLWARGAGGGGPDEGYGIAVDAAGNSYVTGLTGAADFGDGVTFPGVGVFVAKYDTDGHAQWVAAPQPAGIGFAIAVDSSGNTYATGYAPDPILGGSVVTTWKVSANGTPVWSRQATGNYFGGGASIAVDAVGNSYVTGGLFGGIALFGPGEPNQTPLTDTGGGGQMFVAKYDSAGNLVWAKQSADLLGLAYGVGIDVDSDGNGYVVGTGTTVLGQGEPNETAAGGDNFLAKYNSSGQLVWAKSMIGRPAGVHGVAVDTAGRVFITGGFAGALTFAPGEPNHITLLGASDVFVARYEPDGAFNWVRQACCSTSGLAIAVDGSSNLFVAGIFLGDTTFGPGEATETLLTPLNPGYSDVFVAKYLDDSPPPVNHAPVAHDQSLSTPVNTAIAIVLTGHDDDGDPLDFEVLTGPSHGNLTGMRANRTYTPHTNYTGPDSFTFRVFDGLECSLPATVTIAVRPTNLACGGLMSGTIVAAGEVDDYSFAGLAGQIISLVVASTGGFTSLPSSRSAEMTLVSPAGVVLGTLVSNSQQIFQLPANGVYVVRVAARNRRTTGSYNVNLECLVPVQSPPAVPLSCGDHRSATISAPGQVDLYTFEGQPGRVVSLAVASTGGFAASPGHSQGLEAVVFAPSGTLVRTFSSNSQVDLALTESGTYVVRVNATRLAVTGSYNLSFSCLVPAVSPPAKPLACGAPAAGTIDAPGRVDLYTFDGQAGSVISLSLISTGGFSTKPGNSRGAQLTLFAPDGTSIGILYSNGQASFTLPATGAYIVRINATRLSTTGSYSLTRGCQ
jgi:hypothetical protein